MSNYRVRTKNRKLKRRIWKFLRLFSLKSRNLNIPSKVLLAWVILSIVSLFLPWIKETQEDINYNSFSLFLWMKWYFILLLDLFIIFILLSHRRKETFKLNTRFFFKDNYVIFFSWVLLFIFSLETFFNILWLEKEKSSAYINWKWLVLSFVSSILIIISWIVFSKNTRKNSSLVTNDSKTLDNENIENTKNMRLPFN